jgi:hypothetical protein
MVPRINHIEMTLQHIGVTALQVMERVLVFGLGQTMVEQVIHGLFQFHHKINILHMQL